MGSVLYEWAIRYWRAGWSVFPLAYGDKRPVIDTWKQYQTTRATEGDVYRWFNNNGHNIAIATGRVSNIFVLDADNADAVRAIEARGIPAKTPITITGNGRHYYFSMPAFDVGNRAKLLPGTDIRGTGGYVVAAPSKHPSGRFYTWLDRAWRPPTAPTWLLDLLKPPGNGYAERKAAPRPDLNPRGKHYGRSAFVAEYAVLCTAVEGQRNEQLNRSAFNLGQLIAAGLLDHGEVYDALLRAALYLGLSERESIAAITSGLNAGMAKPRIVREQVRV